ncbi:cAMP-regulated phosphoprotein 19 [Struthio camelus]|uniref:cAMP-regulated phosphoprotein 19 n=1 Tax=Struthio camelus TaxID=8801 RepID=UPI0036042D2E
MPGERADVTPERQPARRRKRLLGRALGVWPCRRGRLRAGEVWSRRLTVARAAAILCGRRRLRCAAGAAVARPRQPFLRRRRCCRGAMSAESPEPASAEEQKEMEDKVISPEKAEEAKLKARYPHLGQKPGGSDFLRKRLQKGQKYFDSGDYNMAKAKMKNKQLPTAAPDKTEVTGDHIPTPQDLPQRKPSLVASKLAG